MPTLPEEAAWSADVDVILCYAAWDAQVAHALKFHVKVGVADLVVFLPVVVYVVGQVITPDVALSYHPPLLLVATFDDLHIAMPTCLNTRGECV